MELRQLRYFIQSAETLNFTEAAHFLHISQSTLSQQIKQLEDELGMLLFDRVGKRVRLTEAGKLFLPYARQSTHDSESGRHVIQDLKGLLTGVLNIGVTYGLNTLLTPTLIAFSKQYPNIKIIVDFGTSEDLLEKLKHVEVDFILSFSQAEEKNMFVTQPLFESRLSLVFHPSNPISKKKSIAVRELAGIPLVMPAKGFTTHRFLIDVFRKNKITPDIKMELNDINTLLQLVETGNWCTILTIAAIKGRQSLKTIPITGIDIKRQASITWLKDVYHKKAALVFTEMIQKQMK